MIRLYLKSKSGFSLTLITASVAIIMVILMSSFESLSFFTRNMATTDALMQQAYYNANSGVEYARFIIEHFTTYDPFHPDGSTGKALWPKGGNGPSSATFQCFDGDPGKGTVVVSVASDQAVGGYNINSTGTVRDKTITINKVHVTAAGKVETWQ